MPSLGSQLRRLARGSAGFSLGSVLSLGIGFLLIPVYTRYLSPADYGIVSLLDTVGMALNVFCLFGVSGAVARFYVEYKGEELKSFLGTMYFFVLANTLVILLLVYFLAGPAYAWLVDDPSYPFHPLADIKLLTLFFASGSVVTNTVFRMEERSFTYSLVAVAGLVLQVGAAVTFVVVLDRKAQGVLEAGLLAGAALFLVYLWFLRGKISRRLSWSKLKVGLLFALPILPHALANFVLDLSDRLILQKLMTLADVGLYAVGCKVGILMKVLVNSFAMAWTPYFLRTVKRDGRFGEKGVITYWTLAAALAWLVLSLFSREALLLLTTPDYYAAAAVVPWIAGGAFFRGMYIIPTSSLSWAKKPGYYALVTIPAGILNVALNFLLIPRLGIVGAGVSTLVAFAFTFLLGHIFSAKFLEVDYEWGKISAIVILAASVVVSGHYLCPTGLALGIAFKIGLVAAFLGLLRLAGVWSLAGLGSDAGELARGRKGGR